MIRYQATYGSVRFEHNDTPARHTVSAEFDDAVPYAEIDDALLELAWIEAEKHWDNPDVDIDAIDPPTMKEAK